MSYPLDRNRVFGKTASQTAMEPRAGPPCGNGICPAFFTPPKQKMNAEQPGRAKGSKRKSCVIIEGIVIVEAVTNCFKGSGAIALR
jgi:hypothetical protein